MPPHSVEAVFLFCRLSAATESWRNVAPVGPQTVGRPHRPVSRRWPGVSELARGPDLISEGVSNARWGSRASNSHPAADHPVRPSGHPTARWQSIRWKPPGRPSPDGFGAPDGRRRRAGQERCTPRGPPHARARSCSSAEAVRSLSSLTLIPRGQVPWSRDRTHAQGEAGDPDTRRPDFFPRAVPGSPDPLPGTGFSSRAVF